MTVEQRHQQRCSRFRGAGDEAGALVEAQVFHCPNLNLVTSPHKLPILPACRRLSLVPCHMSLVTLICCVNQLSPRVPKICCFNINRSSSTFHPRRASAGSG